MYEGDEVGYPDHPILVDLYGVQEEVTLVPGEGLHPALPAEQMSEWHDALYDHYDTVTTSPDVTHGYKALSIHIKHRQRLGQLRMEHGLIQELKIIF